MRIISHRGNLTGHNPASENKVEYIQKALDRGFDVEVDVWYLGEKGLMLGHDSPSYLVDRSFLCNKRIWSHAKNIESFLYLSQFIDINVFYQTNDDISLTSRGFVWANSNINTTITHKNMIKVSLEYNSNLIKDNLVYGICTDYPITFKKNIKSRKCNIDIFKLLVIDIDGVMTDGTKEYGLNGEVTSKRYCDLDFTAIKRFKAAGIQVCFLSGDTIINKKMAETRKIDYYHARLPSGNIDKSEFIPILCKKYNVGIDDIAYVGDDYYDLSIIESLKYTFCPSTANNDIKRRCYQVLNIQGGHGVLSELYEVYRNKLDFAFPVDSVEVNPR